MFCTLSKRRSRVINTKVKNNSFRKIRLVPRIISPQFTGTFFSYSRFENTPFDVNLSLTLRIMFSLLSHKYLVFIILILKCSAICINSTVMKNYFDPDFSPTKIFLTRVILKHQLVQNICKKWSRPIAEEKILNFNLPRTKPCHI